MPSQSWRACLLRAREGHLLFRSTLGPSHPWIWLLLLSLDRYFFRLVWLLRFRFSLSGALAGSFFLPTSVFLLLCFYFLCPRILLVFVLCFCSRPGSLSFLSFFFFCCSCRYSLSLSLCQPFFSLKSLHQKLQRIASIMGDRSKGSVDDQAQPVVNRWKGRSFLFFASSPFQKEFSKNRFRKGWSVVPRQKLAKLSAVQRENCAE